MDVPTVIIRSANSTRPVAQPCLHPLLANGATINRQTHSATRGFVDQRRGHRFLKHPNSTWYNTRRTERVRSWGPTRCVRACLGVDGLPGLFTGTQLLQGITAFASATVRAVVLCLPLKISGVPDNDGGRTATGSSRSTLLGMWGISSLEVLSCFQWQK